MHITTTTTTPATTTALLVDVRIPSLVAISSVTVDVTIKYHRVIPTVTIAKQRSATNNDAEA